MPAVGNFPQSRMREIFTSGSSRGEWVVPFTGSPSLLLYRYAACHPLKQDGPAALIILRSVGLRSPCASPPTTQPLPCLLFGRRGR